jgi:hypothetical protein
MDDAEPRLPRPDQGLTRSSSVARGTPGAHWWMYQRPEAEAVAEAPVEAEPETEPEDEASEVTPMLPGGRRANVSPRNGSGNGNGRAKGNGNGDASKPTTIVPPVPSAAGHTRERLAPPVTTAAPQQNGIAYGAIACLLFFVMWAGHKAGSDQMMVICVPPITVFGAIAFGRRCARRYPDEPFLPKFLLAGAVAKLVAAYFRYLVLVTGYDGVGDATEYDQHARLVVNGWHGLQPQYNLKDLSKSNFIIWFTSVLYDNFGAHLVGAYLFYAALAIIGSYCWYRATCEAIPYLDKKLYLALCLFMPSILFWPAALGKEALMLVSLGMLSLAVAKLLTGRVLTAVPYALFGGWLTWIVRAHLLAMVTIAAAIAYFFGRIRKKGGTGTVKARPITMVLVAVLLVFTVTQAMKSLGLQDLSQDSITTELNAQTARTNYGSSKTGNAPNSLSPLSIPQGAVTVLLRPFPWEAGSSYQLLSSAESVFLIFLMLKRWSSMRNSLRRARSTPFLLYCWILILIYCTAFSSFANLGLLTRERSLVLPAVYVLIAIDPVKALELDEEEAQQQLPSGRPSGRA